MKVVIKGDCGCFSLSAKAITKYNELRGLPTFYYVQTKWENRDGVDEYRKIGLVNDKWGITYFTRDFGNSFNKITDEMWESCILDFDIPRTDPILIQTIEELDESDRDGIKVVEIPDGIDWYIRELEDGREIIEEKHRTWC